VYKTREMILHKVPVDKYGFSQQVINSLRSIFTKINHKVSNRLNY